MPAPDADSPAPDAGPAPAKKRGRVARRPGQIPPRGWLDVAKRIWFQLSKDHVPVISAGVAFYFFLALFPALAVFISIYGLILEPSEIQSQMDMLAPLVPVQAYDLLHGLLDRMATESDSKLGWSLLVSLLFSVWSAKKGMTAIFEGANIVYKEEEKRSILTYNAVTLLFTFGGILLGVLSLVLIVLLPALASYVELPDLVLRIIDWSRWVVLAAIIMFALATIYRFAPQRSNARVSWVSWGAVIATLLWLLASFLFSWYMNNFGSFDKMYGSFAAVVMLMLWFFLTGFFILLGAEINAELEHQTREDTTTGTDQPLGERGAYYADHVAE